MSLEQTTYIKVDIARQEYNAFSLQQGDKNSRKIEIEICNKGEFYTIPNNASAKVLGSRADGKNIGGDATITNNKIYYTFTDYDLGVNGNAQCKVELFESVGSSQQTISSFPFTICVHKNPYNEDEIIESTEFSIFTNALLEATKIADYETVGRVKPDGTTIIIDANGTITAIGGGGGGGTTFYLWLRYSSNADGTNFVATPTTDTKYIGFYSGVSSTAPTSKTSYVWSKYVGDNGVNGTNGQDGINGVDGIGITSITKTNTTGLIDTYTVTYSNSTTSTFTITNGQNGTSGVTPNFTIGTVTTLENNQNATATITGTPENPVLNLGIPKGADGTGGGGSGTSAYCYIKYSTNADGTSFVDNPTNDTIYIGIYSGISSTPPTLKTDYIWSKYVGSNGSDGTDGVGIASIQKTQTLGLIDLYTITYTNNTTFVYQVTNGENGTNGQDGTDGFSPTITENSTNTSTSYKLDITTSTGTVTTPNLKGQDGSGIGAGVELVLMENGFNLNSAIDPSKTYVQDDTTALTTFMNCPTVAGKLSLKFMPYSTSATSVYGIQHLINTIDNQTTTFIRECNNGAYSPWRIEYLGYNITMYVSTIGNDITGDGTQNKPYATVQHAVDLLPRNLNRKTVIINVGEGIHDGFLLDGVDGNLQIIGAGVDKTKLIPRDISEFQEGIVKVRNCNCIILKDFNIDKTTRPTINTNTIMCKIDTSNSIYIENVDIKGIKTVPTHGFYLNKAVCTIQNSKVENIAYSCVAATYSSLVVARNFSGTNNTTGYESASGSILSVIYNALTSPATLYSTEWGGRIYEGAQTSVPKY